MGCYCIYVELSSFHVSSSSHLPITHRHTHTYIFPSHTHTHIYPLHTHKHTYALLWCPCLPWAQRMCDDDGAAYSPTNCGRLAQLLHRYWYLVPARLLSFSGPRRDATEHKTIREGQTRQKNRHADRQTISGFSNSDSCRSNVRSASISRSVSGKLTYMVAIFFLCVRDPGVWFAYLSQDTYGHASLGSAWPYSITWLYPVPDLCTYITWCAVQRDFISIWMYVYYCVGVCVFRDYVYYALPEYFLYVTYVLDWVFSLGHDYVSCAWPNYLFYATIYTATIYIATIYTVWLNLQCISPCNIPLYCRLVLLVCINK
jgi:hypothetical protein